MNMAKTADRVMSLAVWRIERVYIGAAPRRTTRQYFDNRYFRGKAPLLQMCDTERVMREYFWGWF